MNIAIEQILENRLTLMVEWVDAHPSCGPEGNYIDACITKRASVHDCINMHRYIEKINGGKTEGRDGERLAEFMDLHYAEFVKEPDTICDACGAVEEGGYGCVLSAKTLNDFLDPISNEHPERIKEEGK